MPEPPEPLTPTHEFEGDYRPAESSRIDSANIRVETADLAYLVQMADTLNTTLDLQTLLSRTAEMVRAIIPYKIFAILLLNDRTQDLRMRFQIGHTPEVERMKFPLGKGVAGPITRRLQEEFFAITSGSKPDHHNWLTPVNAPVATAR